MKPQIPDIHLNGTSVANLMEGYENAADALNLAYNALKQTAPNGRDYYTLPPGAMERASNEHRDRLSRLDDIRDELELIMEGINKQAKK